MKEVHDHKRVTPEGRVLGAQTARLADNAAAHLARIGEADERCKSCAFRAGTVPNGCLQTQADVVKCLVERVPFGCHQPAGGICHGWYAAQVLMRAKEKATGQSRPNLTCPWEFSPPDEAEEAS